MYVCRGLGCEGQGSQQLTFRAVGDLGQGGSLRPWQEFMAKEVWIQRSTPWSRSREDLVCRDALINVCKITMDEEWSQMLAEDFLQGTLVRVLAMELVEDSGCGSR